MLVLSNNKLLYGTCRIWEKADLESDVNISFSYQMHFSKIIHHFPGHNPQQNKFVGTKHKLLIVIYLFFIETSLNTSFEFQIR